MITISNFIFGCFLPFSFQTSLHNYLPSRNQRHDSSTFPTIPSMNSWNVSGQLGTSGAIGHLAKTNLMFWVDHLVLRR